MVDSDVIVERAIDVASLLRQVAAVGRGGTVVFLGSVRRSPDDGEVEAIEYSAYEEMVEEECRRILEEAGARWPETACVLQHRVGRVPAGEPSIAAVAAAPHRQEAFAACRYVVDEAKLRLPVWKKERFADGVERWRDDEGEVAASRGGPPSSGKG